MEGRKLYLRGEKQGRRGALFIVFFNRGKLEQESYTFCGFLSPENLNELKKERIMEITGNFLKEWHL